MSQQNDFSFDAPPQSATSYGAWCTQNNLQMFAAKMPIRPGSASYNGFGFHSRNARLPK